MAGRLCFVVFAYAILSFVTTAPHENFADYLPFEISSHHENSNDQPIFRAERQPQALGCLTCNKDHPYPDCLSQPQTCAAGEVCLLKTPLASVTMQCIQSADCHSHFGVNDVQFCCVDNQCLNLALQDEALRLNTSHHQNSFCLESVCELGKECNKTSCADHEFCEITLNKTHISGNCLPDDEFLSCHFNATSNPLSCNNAPCTICCETATCVNDLLTSKALNPSGETLATVPPTTTPTVHRATTRTTESFKSSISTQPASSESTSVTKPTPNPLCKDTVVNNGCQELQAKGICADEISLTTCPLTCGRCDAVARLQCTDSLANDACAKMSSVSADFCLDAFAINVCPLSCNLCEERKQLIIAIEFPQSSRKPPPNLLDVNASASCHDLIVNNGCQVMQNRGFCTDPASMDVCPVTCGHCDLVAKLRCADSLVEDNCRVIAAKPGYCSDSYIVDICPRACNACERRKQALIAAAFPSTTSHTIATSVTTTSTRDVTMIGFVSKATTSSVSVAITTPSAGTCADTLPNNGCASRGTPFCNQRSSADVCPVTCGFCELLSTIVCEDTDESCSQQQSNPGFCQDPEAMNSCTKTCNLCAVKREQLLNTLFGVTAQAGIRPTAVEQTTLSTSGTRPSMGPHTTLSASGASPAGEGQTTLLAPGSCIDRIEQYNTTCDKQSNPCSTFVSPFCQKTCKLCA